MRYLILILFIFLGCTEEPEMPDSDLIIINANIYFKNAKDPREVTQSLLEKDGDIYLLVEGSMDVNVDSALWVENGYDLYDVGVSTVSANIIVASRIEGEFGHYTPTKMRPISTFRIPYNDRWLSILGVHTPTPHYSDPEDEDRAFEQLRQLGEKGKAAVSIASMVEGDLMAVGGDFNCFPTDPSMKTLTDMGLEDGAANGGDPYQYSWAPHLSPTKFARIDYLFLSPEIPVVYQGCFSVPGTDHEAIITGVNY